tara:strand:- start:54 stop:350 length:297 start_codon:yes stop_codon:yes gene_type:complete
MNYAIKDKKYSEFDINKRCAELMGIDCSGIREDIQLMYGIPVDYCNNPSDTWPIIEKCWDELHSKFKFHPLTDWEFYASEHGSKLIAACICFIELNES